MKKIFIIGCFILLTACNLGTQPPVTESILIETLQPTLPTVAETQTVDFTTTVPPTSEPLSLYFTEEFTSVSSYWEFFQTGGVSLPTTTFENDSLRVDISSPDTWMIGIHNGNTYPNVYLRAKANISATGSFGLICRYNENTGWYEFNIYSDGTYNLLLGQWLTEGVAKYVPINTEFSGHITPSTQIGMHCQGNFILLYVNDTLVRRTDVTNYGLGEGQVGITASSLAESAVSVVFEWVKVSEE